MDETQKQVIEILRENVTVEEENDDRLLKSNFQSMGINSLNFIKIVVAVEETFDIEFDDEDINYNALQNVKDMVELIEKMRNSTGRE